jgi:hypothetical protein
MVIGSIFIKKCKSANLKKSKSAKLRFGFEANRQNEIAKKRREKFAEDERDCERTFGGRKPPTISKKRGVFVPLSYRASQTNTITSLPLSICLSSSGQHSARAKGCCYGVSKQ